MKITRLHIRNYRGIEEREVEVPPHGAVIKGKNGGGKTSVLTAIRAALASHDVGPDAIRIGSERAEILLDIDDIAIKRVIKPTGSNVTVMRDGVEVKRPQTFLNDLLGNSAFDPLDLLRAKPKDRRSLILAAVPCRATADDVARWCGAETPPPVQLEEHGLSVVERLHSHFYEKRKLANARAEEAERSAKGRRDAVPAPAIGVPSFEEAEANLERCIAIDARLRESQKNAEANAALGEQLLAEIHAGEEAKARKQEAYEMQVSTVRERDKQEEVVRQLEQQLSAARTKLANDDAKFRAAVDRVKQLAQAIEVGDRARTRMQGLDFRTPTAEALAQSAHELEDARATAEKARAMYGRERLLKEANDEADRAKACAEIADRLDAIVATLRNKAPAELLARSGGIPGLTVEGDDVRLDGVSLDGLCGAERVWFAVQVAKRLNAKSKILVVDGLESLDPDEMEAFVKYATDGDWQLLATRVDRGEVVFEALS